MHPSGLTKGSTVRHIDLRGISGEVLAVDSDNREAKVKWNIERNGRPVVKEDVPFSELVLHKEAAA